MECFVCSEKLNQGYLCRKHSEELKKMLEKREGIINSPNWKHHCLICGEHKGKVIVEYPQVGYFCDTDICEEWNRNNSL